MDKAVQMGLLFDFFGPLLTDKQREYFDLYYNQNLSLSEIAENSAISRQSVRDAILRTEAFLTDTEQKTGIVARYMETQAALGALEDAAAKLVFQGVSGVDDILESIKRLKG